MAFAGFSQDTIGFLRALDAQNDRAWFAAHRADYQALWLQPGLDLAAELSWPVARHGLLAVPRLNASLRRLHRDTRFSADKRPFHARLHLILSTGPEFNKVPGVHLVIGPRGFGHGVGQWAYDPAGLHRLRRAFCDPGQRDEFLAHLARAQAQGAALDPPDLARLPKGHEAEPAWEHLLRRKHVVVRSQDEGPHPDWLFGPGCVNRLAALAAELAPLARWLAARL